MTIYSELQGDAKELFKEFAQGEIAYIKSVPGNGPVDNPGPPSTTRFVLAGATARGVKSKYVLTGQAIATDLQVNMPVDDRFSPENSGFVEVDGMRLKIVKIIRKPTAGTPIAYTLIVRKGI